MAQVTREEKSTTYLIQRLAVAVQRGNAASVLGTTGQMTPYTNFLTFFVCLFAFEFYLLIFFVHVHILCFSHPFGFVCVCLFNKLECL